MQTHIDIAEKLHEPVQANMVMLFLTQCCFQVPLAQQQNACPEDTEPLQRGQTGCSCAEHIHVRILVCQLTV